MKIFHSPPKAVVPSGSMRSRSRSFSWCRGVRSSPRYCSACRKPACSWRWLCDANVINNSNALFANFECYRLKSLAFTLNQTFRFGPKTRDRRMTFCSDWVIKIFLRAFAQMQFNSPLPVFQRAGDFWRRANRRMRQAARTLWGHLGESRKEGSWSERRVWVRHWSDLPRGACGCVRRALSCVRWALCRVRLYAACTELRVTCFVLLCVTCFKWVYRSRVCLKQNNEVIERVVKWLTQSQHFYNFVFWAFLLHFKEFIAYTWLALMNIGYWKWISSNITPIFRISQQKVQCIISYFYTS